MDHEVEQYTSKRRLASKLSWGGYQKGGEYAMQQLVIWAVFCSLVLVLCLIRPNSGRIFVGLFFLVMAIGVNVVTVFVDPNAYVGLGADSFIPLYRWVFIDLVALAPPLFVLPVAAFEIAIALLILSKGRYAKWGFIGGIVFLLAITPLGVWRLVNPIMAVTIAYLLTKGYDRSFLEMLHLTSSGKLEGRG
jgi:hypothetical protein